MSLKISPTLAALLREVIAARRPDLMQAVNDSRPLSDDDREALREALADELMTTGLRADSEPNERGLQLEEIIDVLARL